MFVLNSWFKRDNLEISPWFEYTASITAATFLKISLCTLKKVKMQIEDFLLLLQKVAKVIEMALKVSS